MEKLFDYRIRETDSGTVIRDFLRVRGFSRRILALLKRTEDGICVDGRPVYANVRLRAGERLTVRLREEDGVGKIPPVDLPLSVVYEDGDLLVVNKSAGMPVHPSQGNHGNTLANAAAWYFKEKGEPFVFRAVNRLDRDTTGLLLIARHAVSAARLSEAVAAKEVRREYLAVAQGRTEESGTICRPIARVDGSAIERCVDDRRGEYACTHYRRLHYDSAKDCSLLLLTLETGRTHQIRVHMKAEGHPILGDFLYHPDYRYIARQALHSFRLTFPHPVTGERLSFTAPPPEDFQFLTGDLLHRPQMLPGRGGEAKLIF